MALLDDEKKGIAWELWILNSVLRRKLWISIKVLIKDSCLKFLCINAHYTFQPKYIWHHYYLKITIVYLLNDISIKTSVIFFCRRFQANESPPVKAPKRSKKCTILWSKMFYFLYYLSGYIIWLYTQKKQSFDV